MQQVVSNVNVATCASGYAEFWGALFVCVPAGACKQHRGRGEGEKGGGNMN